MKKAFALVLAALLAVTALGCNPTQSYTCLDLTMDIPKDITDVSEAEENIMFHFALENDYLFICGIRQDFLDIADGAAMTLDEYTHRLMELYELEDIAIHAQRDGRDYIYLRFQVPLEDGVHQYLCGVYRAPGGFWLIQMDARTADFDEERCFSYLDSVRFN